MYLQRAGREFYLTWYIRFAVAVLHVLQHPPLAPLGDELPTEDTILGEVHVGRKHVGMLTVERFSLEVLAQGPVACLVVLQSVVSVGAEGTGKHSDVSKDGLEWLVENVGHLVLEVLGSDERVEEVFAEFALLSTNLTTSAGDVGVCVEGLPQVVQRGATGTSSDIEQDADVGVQGLAEGVEAPAMGVELALVLLLQAEEELAGHDTLLSTLKLEIRVE